MKQVRAALRYAKAVLNLSIEKNVAEEVNNDMQLITATIESSKDLEIMLNSPVIKSSAKKEVLSSIFKGKINAISQGLINQLVDNKRLAILDDVAKKYTIIYDHHKGTQVAKVTSAVPLTDDLKNKVLAKIKEIIGKEVAIENIVDASIIGGFIIRIGDKQFDASVSGKINNLRRQLA